MTTTADTPDYRYRNARGAMPWLPGFERPEEVIRRLRDLPHPPGVLPTPVSAEALADTLSNTKGALVYYVYQATAAAGMSKMAAAERAKVEVDGDYLAVLEVAIWSAWHLATSHYRKLTGLEWRADEEAPAPLDPVVRIEHARRQLEIALADLQEAGRTRTAVNVLTTIVGQLEMLAENDCWPIDPVSDADVPLAKPQPRQQQAAGPSDYEITDAALTGLLESFAASASGWQGRAAATLREITEAADARQQAAGLPPIPDTAAIPPVFAAALERQPQPRQQQSAGPFARMDCGRCGETCIGIVGTLDPVCEVCDHDSPMISVPAAEPEPEPEPEPDEYEREALWQMAGYAAVQGDYEAANALLAAAGHPPISTAALPTCCNTDCNRPVNDAGVPCADCIIGGRVPALRPPPPP